MAKKKLLVIEDELDLRIGIKALVRRTDYEDLVFAEDAMGAMSVAMREKPDVILLDIGLPAGDGFVVMERLRRNARLSHIPVVVLSARSAPSVRQRMLDAGAVAFLAKPAEREEILAALDRALDA